MTIHADTTDDLIRPAAGMDGTGGWYFVLCAIRDGAEVYITHRMPQESHRQESGGGLPESGPAVYLVCADPHIVIQVPLQVPVDGTDAASVSAFVSLDVTIRPDQVETFFNARLLRPVEILRNWVGGEGRPLIVKLWGEQKSDPGYVSSGVLDQLAARYGITINAIRVSGPDVPTGGVTPTAAGAGGNRPEPGWIDNFFSLSNTFSGEQWRLRALVEPLFLCAERDPGVRGLLLDLLRWSVRKPPFDFEGPAPSMVLDIVGLSSATAVAAVGRGMTVVMAPPDMLKRHLWVNRMESSLRDTAVEDLDPDHLPDLVFAMSVDHHRLLLGSLGDSTDDAPVRDRLRRFHNQAVIAQSWLGTAGEDLLLILIGPGASGGNAEWQRIANEIERDERICRKLVWLPPAESDAFAASCEAFLGRTFLACPWRDCGQPGQHALDWMARLMAEVGGGKLDPAVASRWFALLEQPDMDRDELVEALVAALEQAP